MNTLGKDFLTCYLFTLVKTYLEMIEVPASRCSEDANEDAAAAALDDDDVPAAAAAVDVDEEIMDEAGKDDGPAAAAAAPDEEAEAEAAKGKFLLDDPPAGKMNSIVF